MYKKTKYNTIKVLTLVFIINAIIEVIGESFNLKNIIYVTKPLIPIILMFLYYVSSNRHNLLFFLILTLAVFINLLFISKTYTCIFYGIIIFTINRILMLYYVFKVAKLTNIKSFILCTIPMLVVFFYLFADSLFKPRISYELLLFQIFLIAIFAGFALSKYILQDNRQNSYLMICALLFMALQFVIFVENYFQNSFDINTLRPVVMTFNVAAFYSFYRFIIVSEESGLDNN